MNERLLIERQHLAECIYFVTRNVYLTANELHIIINSLHNAMVSYQNLCLLYEQSNPSIPFQFGTQPSIPKESLLRLRDEQFKIVGILAFSLICATDPSVARASRDKQAPQSIINDQIGVLPQLEAESETEHQANVSNLIFHCNFVAAQYKNMDNNAPNVFPELFQNTCFFLSEIIGSSAFKNGNDYFEFYIFELSQLICRTVEYLRESITTAIVAELNAIRTVAASAADTAPPRVLEELAVLIEKTHAGYAAYSQAFLSNQAVRDFIFQVYPFYLSQVIGLEGFYTKLLVPYIEMLCALASSEFSATLIFDVLNGKANKHVSWTYFMDMLKKVGDSYLFVIPEQAQYNEVSVTAVPDHIQEFARVVLKLLEHITKASTRSRNALFSLKKTELIRVLFVLFDTPIYTSVRGQVFATLSAFAHKTEDIEVLQSIWRETVQRQVSDSILFNL